MAAAPNHFYFVNVSENSCAVNPMVTILDVNDLFGYKTTLFQKNKAAFIKAHMKWLRTEHRDDVHGGSKRCLFFGRLFSEAPNELLAGSAHHLVHLDDIPFKDNETVQEIVDKAKFDSLWSFEYRTNRARLAAFCGDVNKKSNDPIKLHKYATETDELGNKFTHPVPGPPTDCYLEYLRAVAKRLINQGIEEREKDKIQFKERLASDPVFRLMFNALSKDLPTGLIAELNLSDDNKENQPQPQPEPAPSVVETPGFDFVDAQEDEEEDEQQEVAQVQERRQVILADFFEGDPVPSSRIYYGAPVSRQSNPAAIVRRESLVAR